jgi:hypothetical protein
MDVGVVTPDPYGGGVDEFVVVSGLTANRCSCSNDRVSEQVFDREAP